MASATPSKAEQPITAILAPLLAIIVGMFMVILDGTAMNVALPGLVMDFESSLSTVQWTVMGYALAQAAVIPLAGWLSDRFGAKNIFLISVFLFTVGSGLCALAGSVEQLIAYRILQGIGGGMVAPIAMAFTYRLAPPGKVGAVMGMIGIPMLLAPALGPIVGGWLIEDASWHWIFLINLPIGVIAVLIGLKTLPAIGRQQVPTLDFLGMVFGPLAFAALAYGLSEGGTSWSSAKTITGIVVGGVALILFIIVELNRKQPLLELRVFRSGNFTKGIIVQWVAQVALFGTMFLIPLLLQQSHGYGALKTGVLMLPMAIASTIFMPLGGKLFDRVGARPLVVAGMLIVSIAAFLLTGIDADASQYEYIAPLAMLGAGMGLSMMPLNTHIIQASPAHLVGRVTSLTAALQQVITSFAIAILTTILMNKVGDYNPQYNPMKDPMPVDAFSDTFAILIWVGAAGVLIGFLLSRPKPQEGATGEGAEKPVMMVNH